MDLMQPARQWFQAKRGEKPHELLQPLIQQLVSDSTARLNMGAQNEVVYSNIQSEVPGLAPLTQGSRSRDWQRINLNVTRSCVNAVTAKISKNKPKPAFYVKSGDYSLNRRARKLEKWVEGIFYENKAYRLGPKVFRDASIRDEGGFAKVYGANGHVIFERVPADELFVVENEAKYGEPPTLYHRKKIDRLKLAAMFPDYRSEIMTCPRARDDHDSVGAVADMVWVWEAWRKPTLKGKDDGRHVICIETATLVDEDWTRGFPFARIVWSHGLRHYWGESLVGELRSLQLEIDRLARDIQKAQRMLGQSHWMVEKNSKVNTKHINNDTLSIFEYTGAPPHVYTPQAAPPELYQHLWQLFAKAYEISGISQLSAQGMKPAGLDSGEALKTYHDIETERFVEAGREYEEFFLDLARLAIECAREMAENGEKVTVKGRAKRFIETIDFADVDLEEDEYDMTLFPVSEFPSSPLGKLDMAQQLVQMGAIKDPAQVRRIFNFNEFTQDDMLETAPHDLLLERISAMIDDGRYFSPEPYQDLGDTIRTTQLAYERAQLDGVKEERLELLRQYMAETKRLIDMSQPPAPPQAPPGAPPGMAGPPPGAPPMPVAA